MAINNISLSNTFGQLVSAVQSIISSVNTLETSNYNKTGGTLTISSVGTGLDVQTVANFQSTTRFYANSQFDTWVTASNIRVSNSSMISGVSFTPTKISILGNTGAPFTAALSISRPSSSNAEIRWNETSSYWDTKDVTTPGNYYKIITKQDYATTTANGIVTLNTTVTSSATNLAATASTVKYVYDVSTNAFTVANTARSYAISGLSSANSANSVAVSSFNFANTTNGRTISAFSAANTAFDVANTANNLASNSYYFITTTNVSKTLTNREKCCTTANNLELTLPSSPGIGFSCIVGVYNYTNTIIKNNGANINGVNDTVRIDWANSTVMFTYINSSIGWNID